MIYYIEWEIYERRLHMRVKWICPDCGTVNKNDVVEVINYCQFCDGCRKEWIVETEDVVVEINNIKEVEG